MQRLKPGGNPDNPQDWEEFDYVQFAAAPAASKGQAEPVPDPPSPEEDIILTIAPYQELTLGEFRRFTAALPDEADLHLVRDGQRGAETTLVVQLAIPPASQCDGQPGLVIRYEERDVLDEIARGIWRKRQRESL